MTTAIVAAALLVLFLFVIPAITFLAFVSWRAALLFVGVCTAIVVAPRVYRAAKKAWNGPAADPAASCPAIAPDMVIPATK